MSMMISRLKLASLRCLEDSLMIRPLAQVMSLKAFELTFMHNQNCAPARSLTLQRRICNLHLFRQTSRSRIQQLQQAQMRP